MPPISRPQPLAHHHWLSALTSVMGLPAPDCWCCRLLVAKPFFSFNSPGSLRGLNTTIPEAFPFWTLPLPLPPGHLSTTVLAPSHFRWDLPTPVLEHASFTCASHTPQMQSLKTLPTCWSHTLGSASSNQWVPRSSLPCPAEPLLSDQLRPERAFRTASLTRPLHSS